MSSTLRKTVLRRTIETGVAAEPKRQAFLVPQAGGGEPLALDAPQLIVGRGEDVDYRIRDPDASRRHARILAVHNRYYIQDLGSTNGTFLNGDRVANERLAHGDLVQLGGSLFRVEIGDDLDADYLKKLNLETVTCLAEAVDKKDAYTGSHSESVARVAELLALELGLTAAAAERVAIAGRLHDIGKIGVPDSVLRKAGRLDDDELALIRRHPIDGEAILAPLELLADILPVVRQHHERPDGRGYPDGLRGEAIAREARIVQVADTYHAMASDRPYRQACSPGHIAHEFAAQAGTQFDPEMVEALLRLLPTLPELTSHIH
jgi:HD-GYP domain-containing protein (c-di-GMP phosphodiesterase class II)